MKIEGLLRKTPEMTEEKLLEIISKEMLFLGRDLIKRINSIYHGHNVLAGETPKYILEEWDLIQDKKSYLTRSQRDKVSALVSACLIQMVKKDE